MPNKLFHIIFALFISCFSQTFAYSQQPNNEADPNDKWIRVQSDNGEFSIEVPAKYKYFYNKDGFSHSGISGNYQLMNMSMLNSFHYDTLLSFEVYETKKGALYTIYEQDTYRKDIEKSKLKKGGQSIQQIVLKTDKSYLVRQYFSSKTHIYILTAASRVSETPAMRHFLDSLTFEANTSNSRNSDAKVFSSLPMTDIGIDIKLENDDESPLKKINIPETPTDKNFIPVTILNRPKVSYTEQARQNGVKGTIRLKPTLSAEGFVSNIAVVKTLPDGLLRKALFSAIRLKFLPKENKGIAETAVVTVEYSFDIY